MNFGQNPNTKSKLMIFTFHPWTLTIMLTSYSVHLLIYVEKSLKLNNINKLEEKKMMKLENLNISADNNP